MYVTSFHCPSAEKLAEAQRRFATLQNELQSSLDAQRESNASPGLRKRKTRFHLSQEERCKHHNIKDLKLAFSEFYLSLILLQNYQVFSASTHSDHFMSPAVVWSDYISFPVSFQSGVVCSCWFLLVSHRTWTSLVSVRSWRNMTRSWILPAGRTGVWLMWRWHLSTPARRSHSSLLRRRCLPATRGLYYMSDMCRKNEHVWNEWLFLYPDPGDHRAGGRRSSKGHEEAESSSSGGSSGQNHSWLHWKHTCSYIISYMNRWIEEQRWMKSLWTWRSCLYQTGSAEYFQNCWSAGIFLHSHV